VSRHDPPQRFTRSSRPAALPVTGGSSDGRAAIGSRKSLAEGDTLTVVDGRTSERHGVRVLVLDRTGPLIADEAGAMDVLGQAFAERADVVAVPIARLDPAFTQLRSSLAGAIVQKFVNYRVSLVVVGPLDHHGPPTGPVQD
jgi:hypothetical protein